MAEIFVTNTDGLEEGAVKVIAVANEEIGVIRHKGQCYAYLNRCPHQGGAGLRGGADAEGRNRTQRPTAVLRSSLFRGGRPEASP